MKDDFNKIIKDKLEDYQAAPPAELFDKIKQNYPKRSYVETLKYKGPYIIGSAAIIIIVLGIIFGVLHTTEKTDNSIIKIETFTENTIKEQPEPTKAEEPKPIEKEPEPAYDIKSEQNNLRPETKPLEVLNVNIFEVKDTVICGNIFEIPYNISSADKIILPDNIELINNRSILQFVSSEPGKYLIKYLDKKDNKILHDSMYIRYKSIDTPEISFSSDVLCYNDELLVSVKSSNKNFAWNLNKKQVTDLGKNNYRITGLKSGINNIRLTFSEGICNSYVEKEIKMLDKIENKYAITPNYCSGNNATLNITPLNYSPSYFILDESAINKTGLFENIGSGIHTVKINYGSGCYFYDTLFIADILNLNPYFISEKDPITPNKYHFRNYTKVDDEGYEKNNEIKFIWKINDVEVSSLDNFDYEFSESGSYTIELIAKIYNDCTSMYSEKIIISGNNFAIPNIFTPNGDGIGDIFYIMYDGELAEYNIIITNIQGEKVFESNDIYKPWNGKIHGNNDASEGSYYYVIKGVDNKGSKINQVGTVKLVRR